MKFLIHIIPIFLFLSCDNDVDQILFSSNQNGNSDIFLMDEEGNIKKQISDNPYEEWSPVWINNKEVSFLRQIENDISIVRKDLDTNIETKIPHPSNCIIDDKNIIYSNGGKAMLFVCNGNIFYKLQEKETEINLTTNLTGQSNYLEWVDENSFLFTNNQEGNNEIYLFNLVDQSVSRLTDNLANDERGSISPDGKYLLFSSNRIDSNNQEILLMNLNTREIKNISNSDGNELIARWNKNGQTIYFGSNKDGNWEIYSYDLKTSKTKRLTNNKAFDGDPRIK